jgi:hypothetical protein
MWSLQRRRQFASLRFPPNSKLGQRFEPANDLCLSEDAHRLVPLYSALEEKKCRNASDSEFLRNRW